MYGKVLTFIKRTNLAFTENILEKGIKRKQRKYQKWHFTFCKMAFYKM
jgi:hypothetical protein